MLNISNLVIGETVDLFGIVSKVEQKKTSNNSSYVNGLIEDKSGKVEIKIWDIELKDLGDIDNGDFVKIRGIVGEWNEQKQITIENPKNKVPFIRKVNERDGVNINDFIKCSPIDPQIMWNFLNDLVSKFKNHTLKTVCSKVLEDYKKEFLYYPGAQTVHHAVKGGLLQHTYMIVKSAIAMADIYTDLNKELLIGGAIVHDIGKIVEIDTNENGSSSGYTKKGYLLGHMIEGIKIINYIVSNEKTEIDPEVIVLLEHMIASHHFEESWGAYQKPAFLEAEILHHLDMIDSRLDIILSITEQLDENDFSNPTRYLSSRRIFKHNLE